MCVPPSLMLLSEAQFHGVVVVVMSVFFLSFFLPPEQSILILLRLMLIGSTHLSLSETFLKSFDFSDPEPG